MRRRDFLVSGAGAAAAALGPSAGARAAAAAAGMPTPPAMRLNKAAFTALLNQPFMLCDRLPGATLVLVGIREPAPRSGRNLEQFSLLFDGPDRGVLEAGTHEVAHAELGRFALYLEPAARNAAGPASRADFSLLA